MNSLIYQILFKPQFSTTEVLAIVFAAIVVTTMHMSSAPLLHAMAYGFVTGVFIKGLGEIIRVLLKWKSRINKVNSQSLTLLTFGTSQIMGSTCQKRELTGQIQEALIKK